MHLCFAVTAYKPAIEPFCPPVMTVCYEVGGLYKGGLLPFELCCNPLIGLLSIKYQHQTPDRL